jgi:hypothetical protein
MFPAAGSLHGRGAASLAHHGWYRVHHEWLETLHQSCGTKQEHRNEPRLHGFSRSSRVGRRLVVAFGVLRQLAIAALILIMLGAIQKKIFVWHSGFWGKSGTNGWSYDTMLIVMSLVILTTEAGICRS